MQLINFDYCFLETVGSNESVNFQLNKTNATNDYTGQKSAQKWPR